MEEFKVTAEQNTLEVPEDQTSPVKMSQSRNQMLKFYDSARRVKEKYEEGWYKATDAYLRAFNTDEPNKFEVKSKLIYQAHNLIVRRMQRPGRDFLSDCAPVNTVQLIRDAVNTVQDLGGLSEALTADWGIFSRQVLIGNAPLLITATGNPNNPVAYQALPMSGCYFDPSALYMRTSNGRLDCKEFLYIEETTYDEGKNRYPNLEFVGGPIPVGNQEDRTDEYTQEQIVEMHERNLEIAHYFNIRGKKPLYEVFVGGMAVSAEQKYDKDYGYELDGRDALPLAYFKMFPSPEGFYAYGTGQLLYDLMIVQERLRNLAFTHIGRNVNAISVLNVARGNSGEFMNQMFNARELQAANEFSVILNESGDQGGFAKMEQLRTDPLTSEYERMQNELTLEIKRCGFPIDEVDRPVTETATATRAELGATTQFVQQIQENNRDAYRDIELLTLCIIKKDCQNSTLPIITVLKKDDGTNVNSKEALMGLDPLTGKVQQEEPYNLGDAADALKEYSFAIKTDSRTGAFITNAERGAALSEAMQMAAPLGGSRDLLNQYLINKGLQATDLNQKVQPPQGNTPVSSVTGGVATMPMA